MAFEILNQAIFTPHRIHALLHLVIRLREPKREELNNLLQPGELVDKQTIVKEVYNAARNCNLITEDADGVVKLAVDRNQIETMQSFRRHMQRILTGVTDAQDNNYLLNLYTAWYAVQNEQVLTSLNRKDFETNFNDQVYPDVEDRQFNSTKFNGWRTWATFLGWGRLMRISTFEVLVPDATARIEPILDDLLPAGEQLVQFSSFAHHLAEACPELDGGPLFEYCWQASRGAEQRGNSLSLMLSTALRVHHHYQRIELVRQPDADQLWQLYPAMGHSLQEVSHIRRRSTQ